MLGLTAKPSRGASARRCPYPSASHLLKRDLKHACVSSWTRIPDNVMPPRIKNIANYRNGSLASSEASINVYYAAILLNTRKFGPGDSRCGR